MDFKSKRGSISIFALIVTSVIALSIGSLMMSNFLVYQLSKLYHILREQLLIKKMLFQVTEEVVLSKYELSLSPSGETLENLLSKEIESVFLKFDEFQVVQNGLKDFNFENFVFENGYRELNPRLSSYLNQGPYVDRGEALFNYTTNGYSYRIRAHGYGVPISNFNWVCYDLLSSSNQKGKSILNNQGLYILDEEGRARQINTHLSAISYKKRKDISFFCNAYEWLWQSDYLQKLGKESVNNFILEIPYDGDLEDNGILLKNDNEVTLDLAKIDYDVVTISNPFGGGSIKIEDTTDQEKLLVIICYNHSKLAVKTLLEIDESLTRPIIVFAINTNIRFQNNPHIKGAFLLDPNSKAAGQVVLDGHFSCYSGSDFLNELDVNFDRTDALKTKLAHKVPHIFVTDVCLYE